jgi:hypothetical protein
MVMVAVGRRRLLKMTKLMNLRILDSRGKPWFYQFGNLYGSLKGEALRHIDDILRRVKND